MLAHGRPSETPLLSIGLISDTHALVRPEALAALAGSDAIIHAGDIGSPDVLEALRAIAPVHAVSGNVDRGPWASALPSTLAVPAGNARLYVLHRLADLDIEPEALGFTVVVSGHSHKPSIERQGGVLYVNPGSAGSRRFRLPVTVAVLRVDGGDMEAEIIPLNV
ncbi:MAG: metallophosphoesterase family protein [Dehalococcoidia bacterium]